MSSTNNSVVYWGTGRRKTSVARVRLVPGNGTVTINGRPGDNYLNYNHHGSCQSSTANFRVRK